jgi:hypothetical protein
VQFAPHRRVAAILGEDQLRRSTLRSTDVVPTDISSNDVTQRRKPQAQQHFYAECGRVWIRVGCLNWLILWLNCITAV